MDKKNIYENAEIKYYILVIGSGGTGTYFLKEFSRFIATMDTDIRKQIKSLCIADGDRVEMKNLNRQCFALDDIGANKAVAFAEALNDMIDEINNSCPIHWSSYADYITELSQLERLLPICSCIPTPSTVLGSYVLHIPVIIGAVDNDACRLLCEHFFDTVDNCFYFDSGNEYASGECVYAYKIKGNVLAPTKSFYFPVMQKSQIRPVTELSCDELNHSAPQHILTNMIAATQLLNGIMKLFDPSVENLRDRMKCGYSFFDSFASIMEFIPYSKMNSEE